MRSWQSEAKAYALACQPLEACGLVVLLRGRFKFCPCENIASNPADLFIINPVDWMNAEAVGPVVAVFHSHPSAPATPSQADLKACNALGLPWHIYSPQADNWSVVTADSKAHALLGREWVWAVSDCFTLVRDFYALAGLNLPDYQRPSSFEDFAAAPIFDQHWPNLPFSELQPGAPLCYGDMLLLNFDSPSPSHIGVLVEDGQILHHVRHRLSSRDPYSLVLQRATVRRLRYTEASSLKRVAIS